MLNAFGALAQGTRLVLSKGLRRYVVLPVLVNLTLYTGTIVYLLDNFGGWIDYWMLKVPDWLVWLEWLIWPLLVISLVVVVFFTFTLVSSLIAAPFYGFLAEKVERQVTGSPPADDRGFTRSAVDALGREMVKLGYILPRMALLFVLGFVPGVNLFMPFLWAAFSAWMMAITYLDYPMDNNRIAFSDMRRRLRARWWSTLTFGGWVLLATWLPLANLILLPGAVAASVLMWQQHYRQLPVAT